jgi:hypothetical protein
MPLIPYPDVPPVPGVPDIASFAGLAILPAPLFAVLDGLNLPFLQAPIRWGVFTADGQTQALIPDSVVGFEYANSSRVSDYPVEQGAFASYNKVSTPFDVRMRVTVGGTEANRSGFIYSLDQMLAATDLFSLLTPERIYPNVTLVHYDFKRESTNGVTLLTIDCAFREVRIVTAAQFSQTQSVSAESPANQGQVQATDATPIDLKMIDATGLNTSAVAAILDRQSAVQ